MTTTATSGAAGSRLTLKPVVTIFEAYGSGAKDIGPKVADALGLPYHPQAFSSEELEAQEEQREKDGIVTRVMEAMGTFSGHDALDVVFDQQDRSQLVADNNRVVFASAEEGGVITGRNGALILADHPAALHVRLDGPAEKRIERAARDAGISIDRAKKRQRREDQIRADMSIQLYGWDPRLVDHYDLVLNTATLSDDVCVEIIVSALKAKTEPSSGASDPAGR
ncbi:AAA family ATPase [Knoellia aerolata]|uniref:Cytidylate kinase n=1 Tax=Knoellia aerolata DSM 18566 TaxID=1385519 RepID=A0A0A0JU28_9MICO|nr:cytidylate kinase-like family protein [Knoellia aerolata]KGN40214.1 hypothetical protein N801_16230 [Knoellia aerolata DSM 18566]